MLDDVTKFRADRSYEYQRQGTSKADVTDLHYGYRRSHLQSGDRVSVQFTKNYKVQTTEHDGKIT